MKKYKGLSLFLVIAVMLSMLNFSAYAVTNTITAYITISAEGEIVRGTNGDYVAEKPVELTGKENYTLDDLFRKAHELYYDGGADAGYATADSEWGLSVTKVWGDTSGKFGYQINAGAVYVGGPTQAVEDGDYIDLCIYENFYPETEAYAKFDAYTKAVSEDTAELTLYESYYGQNWETLFKASEGAEIWINGEKTGILTDENGKCDLIFEKSGTYVVTAKKSKEHVNAVTGEKSNVCAITAPIQVITATVPDELAIIHSAVKKVIAGDLPQNDQLYWLLGDIAGYSELYPNTKNVISEEEKQKCIDKILAEIDDTTGAAALAKSIIALRSLGYDAKSTYNSKGYYVDITEKLSKLIDTGSADATNIYTLPYVIIAMQEYATDEQMNTLITAAINQKDGEYGWLDSSWGADSATPMLLALAPYSANSDVNSAISEAIAVVSSKQGESGAVQCLDWNTFGWVDSAASTGLSIAGLSAVGTAPETFLKGGKSLIDGLMTLKTEDADGFLSGSFDNEQGLRGLIAWRLLKKGKRIYDFSAYPKRAAYATRNSNGVNPALVTQNSEEPEEKSISVTVKVMIHDEKECDNSYTYKKNASKYSALVSERVEITAGQTVYDATVKALEKNGIDYVDRNGYIASIGDFSEFDHGNNSGWMFLVNGKHRNEGCKAIALEKTATVTWFYTDDYTRESGSENYQKPAETTAPSGNADNTENAGVEAKPQVHKLEESTFTDIKETDWHYSAVKYVYENNLMSGTDKGFEPDSKMTRAMLVSVLFRLSGDGKAETDIAFGDVEDGKWYTDGILWAASCGIVSGVGDNNFAPDSEITREQMAVILYNFAMYKKQADSKARSEKVSEFEDYGEVSDYAKEAISWANAEGFISGESDSTLNPKNSATRAQIASILMRYCEAVNK